MIGKHILVSAKSSVFRIWFKFGVDNTSSSISYQACNCGILVMGKTICDIEFNLSVNTVIERFKYQ